MKGEVPDLKKFVAIGAPHTSGWDFILAVLLSRALNMKVKFLAKKELFTPWFGWFFRWAGAMPVDRSGNHDTVEAAAKMFEGREKFRLALAPEGTRKFTPKWRTGFYHIAKKAGVPIVMFTVDYEHKTVGVLPPFYPTDNEEQDFEYIFAQYKGVKGKYPGLGTFG